MRMSTRRLLGRLVQSVLVFSILVFIFVPLRPHPRHMQKFLEDSTFGEDFVEVSPEQLKQNNARMQLIWDELEVIYDAATPVPPTLHVKSQPSLISASSDERVPDYGGFIDMNESEVQTMTEMHASVIRQLPEYPQELYQGNGIVMTGGGKYMRIALLSLRMLRWNNSTLPVELWMLDQSEYDEELCDYMHDQLRVTCRRLDEIMDFKARQVKSYQLKVLSIMFSSFEHILFLDADNIPIVQPDFLFRSEPFRSHPIVAWQDFWQATMSPLIYKISGLDPDTERKDVSHELLKKSTVESGQLLYNKRACWKALCLSTWYNLFGPKWWYEMFSLDAPGEGDKETFLFSARVLRINFWLVTKGVRPVGYFDRDGFQGTAMWQHNPLEDYIYNTYDNNTRINPIFSHSNFPKLDATHLLGAWGLGDWRLWGTSVQREVGYDMEREVWNQIKWIECDSPLGANESIHCQHVIEHLRNEKTWNEQDQVVPGKLPGH